MKCACKLIFLMAAGCIMSFFLPINVAQADYLVRPMPVLYPAPFPTSAACIPCNCGQPHCYRVHHVKKHRPVRKHYRHYRRIRCVEPGCYVPRCSYRRPCAPQHDFVTFVGGPVPYAPGSRWVEPCDGYVSPDRATGDDDPMIYPGMNIDN